MSPKTAAARYRCHRCGAMFTAYAPAERHADAEHHHRIEGLLAELEQDRRGTDSNRGRRRPHPAAPSPGSGSGAPATPNADRDDHGARDASKQKTEKEHST